MIGSCIARLKTFTLLAVLFIGHQWPAWSQVTVWTQRYDNSRSGVNLEEKILNTSNVNRKQFGKLFSRTVDGDIFTQPLYVPQMDIPNKGTHSVVYVATAHNSVYAFDADDPKAADPLWHVNFGPSLPAGELGVNPGSYKDFASEVGITGTPVIDLAAKTMYLVARTKDADGTYHQKLYALDITSGAAKLNGPVEIELFATGQASDAVGGILSLNRRTANQRAALLLHRGVIYIMWGSHSDTPPYHGWMAAYHATTLKRLAAFNVTPGGEGGGLWQSGVGPIVGPDGNIYITSANGSFNNGQGGANYGNSVLKLGALNSEAPASNLKVLDWFAPHDSEDLNRRDIGLGPTGVLLIPGTNLLLSGAKTGILYLLDITKMGRYQAENDNQIVQSLRVSRGPLRGTPIYFKCPLHGPVIFLWGELDALAEHRIVDGRLETKPVARGTVGADMPGGIISLSSDGDKAGSAIVWASHPFTGSAIHNVQPGILRAYDAADITRELWNSRLEGERDDLGNLAKFNTPTVANGKVYVGTFSKQLVVYGLLPVK